MPFGLSLPPIVVILLLVFVWVLVLVLLVWYLLPWGERGDEAEPARGRAAEPQRPRGARDDLSVPRPPRVRVREGAADEARDERERPDSRDPFDDYGRAGRRRDDLDF